MRGYNKQIRIKSIIGNIYIYKKFSKKCNVEKPNGNS